MPFREDRHKSPSWATTSQDSNHISLEDKSGMRFFLKANWGNKGTNFKLSMCSAIILKWIINIQSKKEKWTCQALSPFIVSSINSYSSLKTHRWHITCEAYPALSNGVNLSPFWVTSTDFYLHLTPALRVLHVPLPLSMKGKDSVLFISCF